MSRVANSSPNERQAGRRTTPQERTQCTQPDGVATCEDDFIFGTSMTTEPLVLRLTMLRTQRGQKRLPVMAGTLCD